MDLLKELGLGGLIGLVIGIGLITWVDPATTAGVELLLFVCAAAGAIVGGVVSAMKRKKEG